jgi:SRSO17 transposase
MTKPIDTAPAMALPPQAMDNLVEERRAYHAIYRPLLQRREQREGAAPYLHGLLLDLPRKSIEPMGLALEDAQAQAVRTLQLFISEGAWDDEVLLQRHWQEVDMSLGEDDGVRTLDGSDFLKQGREAVGMKRQYCGEVGKRAHCPAGVFLGYASRKGSTLWDRRLSLPQEWVEDEAYAKRRQRGGVPAALPCKTKPTLGGAMLQAVHGAGTLRARWIVCDEAFGRDTSACSTTSTAWACGTWQRSHTTPRSGGTGLPRRSRPGRARDANRHGPGAWRATPSPTPSHRWPLRCLRSAGCVGRSRRAARGPWWPALRHCGSSPCARAGPALRSGWSCGAPS